MSSQLRVDSIIPVNGVPTGGGGGIIQIVQASSQTEVTVSTTTYTDTTLSATITPTSASNKIFVVVSQGILYRRSNNDQGAGIRILRNSTVIYTPGEDLQGPFGDGWGNFGSGTFNKYERINVQVLDSPATTSAVTYKTQGRPYFIVNSGDATFNRTSSTTNPVISYITLMEVSG